MLDTLKAMKKACGKTTAVKKVSPLSVLITGKGDCRAESCEGLQPHYTTTVVVCLGGELKQLRIIFINACVYAIKIFYILLPWFALPEIGLYVSEKEIDETINTPVYFIICVVICACYVIKIAAGCS